MSAHKAPVLTAFLCTLNELHYQLHSAQSLQQSGSSLTQSPTSFLTAGRHLVTPPHTVPTHLLLFTELLLPLSHTGIAAASALQACAYLNGRVLPCNTPPPAALNGPFAALTHCSVLQHHRTCRSGSPPQKACRCSKPTEKVSFYSNCKRNC